MAITKANILAEVNKRTGRAETDIDSQIRAVLLDISLDVPVIKSEVSKLTIVGTPSYSLASDNLRKVDAVTIDGGFPINKIASFEEYLELVADETNADRNKPASYIVHNQSLYLYPTPDAVYTVKIYESAVNLNEDAILLPDIYEELMIEGCCFKLLESKGIASTPQAQAHASLYGNLKSQLSVLEIKRSCSGKIQYRDI